MMIWAMHQPTRNHLASRFHEGDVDQEAFLGGAVLCGAVLGEAGGEASVIGAKEWGVQEVAGVVQGGVTGMGEGEGGNSSKDRGLLGGEGGPLAGEGHQGSVVLSGRSDLVNDNVCSNLCQSHLFR